MKVKKNTISVLQYCNEDKATSMQRTIAFKRFNIYFDCEYHTFLNAKKNMAISVIYSIFHKLHFPLDRFNENSMLLDLNVKKDYDVVFIEKCLSLRPSTLLKIKNKKGNKLVCYILDDFLGKGNISFFFNKCIPLYDIIATNKKHNIQEYYRLGAKKVIYFRNAFSMDVHRPVSLTIDEASYFGSDVSFVGTFEKERASFLLFLANNNIKIKVWGWSKKSIESGIEHPNITNMNKHVYLDDYAKVICSSKINLNFLRRSNRDSETTRSVEIPACGGFMLAERTTQHLEFFQEGIEAEYFEDEFELLKKVEYYLKNDKLRIEISQKARERCLEKDYSYDNQIRMIFLELGIEL
jgi:spore maturation protein CgeB